MSDVSCGRGCVRFSLLAAAVALVLGAPVHAQEAVDADSQAAVHKAGKDKGKGHHRGEHRRGDRGQDRKDDATTFDTIHVTAEQIARQALGSSIITADDIARRPPANDLSELIRTMPGVNLAGNSASGMYGNNRQIDLRGMGPENTLILIDGERVGSRQSVKMGRSGERNTRGDTNWVPAEAVERIEVLRGPAAARYGSGASGGVVNIVTRKPTDQLTGSMTLYGLVPEHSDEGGSQRASFDLSGPLARDFSFRLYGNVNKTDADSLSLNSAYASENGGMAASGREGVRNRDINGLLRWDPSEKQTIELRTGFSRQGNIYAGDHAIGSTYNTSQMTEWANEGAETNVMLRRTASITHRGNWDFGTSRLNLAYEDTAYNRVNEGSAGRTEGALLTSGTSTSRLKDYTLNGELNVPTNLGGLDNIWTFGFEAGDNKLEDPYSASTSISGNTEGKAEQKYVAAYAEDNLYLGRWTLTPGLRFDHYYEYGNNLGPSLNAQFKLSENWLLKGGVARAFKAPNLYQATPGFLYTSSGGGCNVNYSARSGCYIMGNEDLKPETSLNKEIGVEWAPDDGWHGSFTYFHNDYRNKITVSSVPIGLTSDGTRYIYLWENASKAIVQGFEGNLKIPLAGERGQLLSWNSNLTYMVENKNEETNQPLSVIPKYTVNTSLDWRPTEALSFMLTGTFYGKQRSATISRTGEAMEGDTLGSYHIFGVSGRYRITRKVSVGFGVNNLGDKRLYRVASTNTSGAAGTSTYNEPGRAYWTSLTFGF